MSPLVMECVLLIVLKIYGPIIPLSHARLDALIIPMVLIILAAGQPFLLPLPPMEFARSNVLMDSLPGMLIIYVYLTVVQTSGEIIFPKLAKHRLLIALLAITLTIRPISVLCR